MADSQKRDQEKSWNEMTPEERQAIKDALLKGNKTGPRLPSFTKIMMGICIFISLLILGWIVFAFLTFGQ